MVTGSPSMARKMPSKSRSWKVRSIASDSARALSSPARIMRWTIGSRSSAWNMCSVRQRPMPSAPNSRARTASSGVSAFVRTLIVRARSAHSMIRSR